MIQFTPQLMRDLSHTHLLKHPFYQAWNDGALPVETIQNYAAQYHHHVKAFPRYLSATHSHCENSDWRQFLLQNLIDEEDGHAQGAENHPELWARFAEGMGVDRQQLNNTPPQASTQGLVNTFMSLSRSSFEEGIGALFAYEHQVPEVAKFKIDALRKHYAVENPRTLSFFEVHQKADIYHTQALADILEQLSPSSQTQVTRAAHIASSALWSFLDGVHTPLA